MIIKFMFYLTEYHLKLILRSDIQIGWKYRRIFHCHDPLTALDLNLINRFNLVAKKYDAIAIVHIG